MVEEEKLMPLETAVRKITLEPARKFGLVGRGEIKEGNFADLTCFKGGEIRFTIVNGVLAMQDGEFKGTFCGRALRHSIPK
jgi:N-acyl-D-aspartate/D-glutamate deacylase